MSRFETNEYFPHIKTVAVKLCQLINCPSECARYFYEPSANPLGNNFELLLKIILIPSNDIVRITNEIASDDELSLKIFLYFSTIISSFREALKKSEKFVIWLAGLPASNVQSLFQTFSTEVDLDNAKQNFKIFSQSLANKKIEVNLLLLCQLIDMSVYEWSANSELSIEMHAPLVALCDVLLDLTPPFFEKNVNDTNITILFISKLKNMLVGIESLPFCASGSTNDKFNKFLRQMHDCIALLQKCLCDASEHFDEILHTEITTHAVSTTAFQPQACAEQMILWLMKYVADINQPLRNQLMVAKIFGHSYRDYIAENQAIFTRVTSSAFAAAVSVSSLIASVSSRYYPIPTLRAGTPPHDLSIFAEKIDFSETSEELQCVIRELLLLRGAGIDSAHRQFVSELIKQFQRECTAKSIIMQMQENPRASTMLVAQLNQVMINPQEMEQCIDSFVRAIQPPQPLSVSAVFPEIQPDVRETVLDDDSDGECSSFFSAESAEEIEEEVYVWISVPDDDLTGEVANSPLRDRTPTPSLGGPE